jgi:AraC family transcriptional regulator
MALAVTAAGSSARNPSRRTKSCASLVLHLSPTLIEATADELLGTRTVELLGGPTADPALAQLGAIVGEGIGYSWRESLFLESITRVAAGQLVRRHARAQVARDARRSEGLSPRQFATVRDLVESRLDRPPTLAEMAGAIQVDRYRFTRLLKRTTRLGPHGYVTQRRIDRARQLLRASEPSLVEIGLAVGFSSQSHFTAVFHRWVGVTPGDYRRDWRGNDAGE